MHPQPAPVWNNNDYPPLHPGAPRHHQKRPAAPKVLGILSIIFGSLVGLYTLAMLAVGGMMGSMSEFSDVGGPAADMIQTMSTYYTIQGAVFSIMSIWLLVLGIGQVQYKAWAGKMSVIWGITGLVVLVGVGILQFVVLGPMFEDAMREVAYETGAAGMSGFGNAMGSIMAIGMIIVYSPYPIILITQFRRRDVIAALS